MRRVQALGPLTQVHVTRLQSLAKELDYTLVRSEDRADVVDQAWLASGRMAAHRVYLRILASRKLGVSRAFVEEHLASKLEMQITRSTQGAGSRAITAPTRTTAPFQVCFIDLAFMPTKAFGGYVGWVALVDHFSLYLLLEPVRNKEAGTIGRVLERWFSLGFVPHELRCDSGKELFGEALKVMQAFKVRTVFSTSSSRSQGLVEKYNGTVKKLLSRAQASQTGKVDWAKEAREITLAHNTTPSPARAGHSPCDLAMPRYGSLAAQLDGPTPSPVVRGSAIDGDWIGAGDPDHLDVKEAREAVRATEQAVAATIDRRATGMVTRSSSQLPPLKVGDKVRVRLSALDPAKRRAEKAKFEKDSLGVFWTRDVFEVTAEKTGDHGAAVFSVSRFRGSFLRADLLLVPPTTASSSSSS